MLSASVALDMSCSLPCAMPQNSVAIESHRRFRVTYDYFFPFVWLCMWATARWMGLSALDLTYMNRATTCVVALFILPNLPSSFQLACVKG